MGYPVYRNGRGSRARLSALPQSACTNKVLAMYSWHGLRTDSGAQLGVAFVDRSARGFISRVNPGRTPLLIHPSRNFFFFAVSFLNARIIRVLSVHVPLQSETWNFQSLVVRGIISLSCWSGWMNHRVGELFSLLPQSPSPKPWTIINKIR